MSAAWRTVPILAALTALTGVLGLTGCGRQFFSAHGSLTSDGGRLGEWHSTPESCTRDPFDGLPDGRTASVATLLWVNPGQRNPKLDNFFSAPDAPMRLEIARQGGQIVATIYTIRTSGTRLDALYCSRLELETREQKAAYPEGRPALAGTIALDCRVSGDRISGEIAFERCEY